MSIYEQDFVQVRTFRISYQHSLNLSATGYIVRLQAHSQCEPVMCDLKELFGQILFNLKIIEGSRSNKFMENSVFHH